MVFNQSDSIKSEDGYIHTLSIVPHPDESQLYSTIDEEKVFDFVKDDNLPKPPPKPLSSSVTSTTSISDPYKITTIIGNNEEKEIKAGEKKRIWNKTHIIGLLAVLLVVVSIVAISVPIAIQTYYTAKTNNYSSKLPASTSTSWGNMVKSTTSTPKEDVSTIAQEEGSSTLQSTSQSSTATPKTEISSSATPETGISSSATPETGISSSATPETEISSSATPETGISSTTTPETGISSSAKPETEISSSATPETEISPTTTSTLSCTSEHKCHDCTCSNSRCPANGKINVTPEEENQNKEYYNCTGACYSEVNANDNNKVIRGCTRDPGSKWTTHTYDGETCGSFSKVGITHYVCFCCGEYCNKADLTNKINDLSCS